MRWPSMPLSWLTSATGLLPTALPPAPGPQKNDGGDQHHHDIRWMPQINLQVFEHDLPTEMKKFCIIFLKALMRKTYSMAVAADAHLAAPAATPIIYDRNDTYVTQVGHETFGRDGSRRIEFGYWNVDPPERVVRATLALEDRRFWWHPGVDPLAVLRAAATASGRRTAVPGPPPSPCRWRGCSTRGRARCGPRR